LAKNGITTSYDDEGFPSSAVFTASIAAAAGTTTVKQSPGRLACAIVTTAGTSSDNATIYDNASGGSGTILAVIPGGGTVGTRYPVDLPAANGITVVNVASGPAFTVGYS
jgi:hypothetical protein